MGSSKVIQQLTQAIFDATNGHSVAIPCVEAVTPNQLFALAVVKAIVSRDWLPVEEMFKAQEKLGFLTFRLTKKGAATEQGTTHHMWAYLNIVAGCLLLGPPEVQRLAERWLSCLQGLCGPCVSPSGECVMAGERVIEDGHPRTSEHLDEALRGLSGKKPRWPKKYGWPAKWPDALGVAAIQHLYGAKPPSKRPRPIRPHLLSRVTIEQWKGQGHHVKVRFAHPSNAGKERAHSAGMDYRTGEKWWNQDPPVTFDGAPEIRVIE
jgi:hypothetical protein